MNKIEQARQSASARPVEFFLKQALSGGPALWPESQPPSFAEAFLETSFDHRLQPLLYHRLSGTDAWQTWPENVRETVFCDYQSKGVKVLLRTEELRRVLARLSEHRIEPVLIKGMPLAHTVYPSPALRPFLDIDLWVAREDDRRIRQLMCELGYEIRYGISGDLVSYQFGCFKKDSHQIEHAYDFHWKISNPQVFSDVLSYEDAIHASGPVPPLGPTAKTLCYEHALLLACVHRIAHHPREHRAVWFFDMHLLLAAMDDEAVERFVGLAHRRKVAAVCHDGLSEAHRWFGSARAPEVLRGLSKTESRREPSARYLSPRRSRAFDLFLDFRYLQSWERRWKFFLELAFPKPDYLLRKYAVSRRFLLPFLYLRRAVEGLVKFCRFR